MANAPSLEERLASDFAGVEEVRSVGPYGGGLADGTAGSMAATPPPA